MDPDEPKKKRLKKLMKTSLSHIFDIRKGEWNTDKYALCKLCEDHRAIKMTNSNTTGLHRHLKSFHEKIYLGILAECEDEV